MSVAPAPQTPIVSASFRDPTGRLFSTEGRILRVIMDEGAVAQIKALLALKVAQSAVETGRLVRTWVLGTSDLKTLVEKAQCRSVLNGAEPRMVLEHERVGFQSFPYEWPPEMLCEAGRLTLDVATELLDEGFGLKDATPYNVLFRGPNPIFVDLLSFERRDPGDPTWLPYAQFVRTFLLPLLVNKYFGISLDQVLITHRDGLEPEEVYRLSGPVQRLFPPFVGLVSLPTWLAKKDQADNAKIYEKKSLKNPERARFILRALIGGLRRSLEKLAPASGRTSSWSRYMQGNNNYSEQHLARKQAFVQSTVEEFRPKKVLDIGCNTGMFSAISARSGAKVVALDYDPVVVGEAWRNAGAEKLDILPLVVNLARPSPAIGWRNRECDSFLDRAHGHFDMVLMLAVIHHLLVTERIPLPDILAMAAKLTKNLAVIEFIAPDDLMFKRLTRGREYLFTGLTPQIFEAHCGWHFEIVRSQHFEGTSRWLYLLRKKSSTGRLQ